MEGCNKVHWLFLFSKVSSSLFGCFGFFLELVADTELQYYHLTFYLLASAYYLPATELL